MTSLQERFFDVLDENEWDIFSIKMLKTTQLTDNEIIQALRHLTKSGSIVKIEREKYRRKNFLNEYVIGNFLAPEGGFAYWTALNMHGLTEQFANKKYIQTSKRRGEFITNFGETYKFVQVKQSKILGYDIIGYGNHQYKITDIEKTIVDCFDLPQYSGGFYELIRAVYRTKLNGKKLINYCRAINNFSVTKRIAILIELFNKKQMSVFLQFASENINKRYILFDSAGFNEGQLDEKWRVKLNITKNDLLEIAKSPY